MTTILGFDTSCDDTAVAVVTDGRTIRSSVVLSQGALHATHGGVVPEVASRRHLEEIGPAVQRALHEAHTTLGEIDAVAATIGPGLAGSLMVGYNLARGLALGRGLPFVPINHLEGHIYAAWLVLPGQAAVEVPVPAPPLLVLIVSGGHTDLIVMEDHGRYHYIGGTRDDAAGEAFDKVGRLLGLSYPGGPAIQHAAATLSPEVAPVTLPRAWMRGSHDFSFSGLKTAVLHLTERLDRQSPEVSQQIAALAAGFQESVAEVLAVKTAAAAREYGVRGVILCGGVAANSVVRARLRAELSSALPLYVPPPSLCTDNGAMIAAAGYHRLAEAVSPVASGDVRPGLALV